MSSNPVRDYLEERERVLEKRIAELEAENGRLREAFRANMLRYAPAKGVDAEIDRVLNEVRKQR